MQASLCPTDTLLSSLSFFFPYLSELLNTAMSVANIRIAHLINILGYLLGSSETLELWMANELPLTQVCRLWAAITTPKAFNRIFIQWSSRGWRSVYNENSFGNTTSDRILSNAVLFSKLRTTQQGLQLVINIACLISVYTFKNDIKEVFKLSERVCNQITTVRINHGQNDFATTRELPTDKRVVIHDAVDYLAQKLPNLNSAELACTDFSKWPTYFALELISAYKKKILDLQLSAARPITHPLVSEHTSLEFNHHYRILFRVLTLCRKSLRTLRLTNIPNSFDWNESKYDSENNRFEFRQLEVLQLAYKKIPQAVIESCNASIDDDGMCEDCTCLSFPNVRYAILDKLPGSCTFFSNKANFFNARKIVILNNIGAARELSKMSLPYLYNLELDMFHCISLSKESVLANEDQRKWNFYAATKKLLSYDPTHCVASMTLRNWNFALDANRIYWRCIVNLNIYNISVGTLIKLVFRLPKLANLTVGFSVPLLENITTECCFMNQANPQNVRLRRVLIICAEPQRLCGWQYVLHVLMDTFHINLLEYVGKYSSTRRKEVAELKAKFPHLSRTEFRASE